MACIPPELQANNLEIGPAYRYILQSFFSLNNPMTTSTTLRNPSISSSTVPPMPAFAKLIELPAYTGLPVLRARILANRVVKSSVPPCVKRGVLRVFEGVALYNILISSPFLHLLSMAVKNLSPNSHLASHIQKSLMAPRLRNPMSRS